MVNLLQARTGFDADTRLVRVAGEMSRQLLDVLAQVSVAAPRVSP